MSLFDLYKNKNLDELMLRKWDNPINESGCNILHIVALNLDRATLDMLLKINPKKFYEYINKPDNNDKYPIDYAKQTLKSMGSNDRSFINYMIGQLNAQPIMSDMTSTEHNIASDPSLTDNIDELKKMNTNVIENINKLTRMIDEEKPILNKKSDVTTDMTHKNPKKVLDLVESLVDDHQFFFKRNLYGGDEYYGGYSGKRVISTYGLSSDTSDNSDYLNLRKKKQSESEMERHQFDPKAMDEFNKLLEVIMKTLGVDEITARSYRALIKRHVIQTNPELAKDDAKRDAEVAKIINNKKALESFAKSNDITETKERTMKMLERRGQRKSSENSSDDKSKDKKKAKPSKKKTTENGYLQSSEIIFSTE